MKIDKSRVRKSTSEVPNECQQLIERLQQCSGAELLDELSKIQSWTFGKCELLHWAQVLDIFDAILGAAAENVEDNKWALKCDTFCEKEKQLVTCILRFTSLLIEHSFSRHLYNSMEHLLVLLKSNDMVVVLEVLNLLYMFSKRSNFITRLKTGEKDSLLTRLQYLAESWGGKDNGFGLADCCNPNKEIPSSATTLHVEFHKEDSVKPKKDGLSDSIKTKTNLNVIHIEHINKLYFKTPAEIMQSLVNLYSVPPEKEMWLFTHVRLATHFADYDKRLKCVQARLQALSVLVYSNAIQDSPPNLLYTGLLEELVEVIELTSPQLTDIRCAALRTLTAIIHLDRNPQFPNRRLGSRLSNIIDVTGASQYHGFLPVLVRNCITSLTSQYSPENTEESTTKNDDVIIISSGENSDSESKKDGNFSNENDKKQPPGKDIEETQSAFQAMTVTDPSKFPVSLTTALFSFLYHLASYDVGGEALVCCGMMESLLQVISWQGFELDHITFVTRAVRVIDLITNIDMLAFHNHGGLHSFINRLHVEVKLCKKDQPFRIRSNSSEPNSDYSPSNNSEDSLTFTLECVTKNMGKSCLPQRAALLKSMLNFLKKAFQDSAFAENIRHLMEGPLPSALKNIIANAEYYGPSLFLLATDVVTVYVYQEPALLSTLQENGLTDVVLYSLLLKEIPATREVLGSLANVFSALCLNAHGLELFELHKPFNKLFHILLSPTYLTAMRRRRSCEPPVDTASNLGNSMDELMRHQPSLRQDATLVIVSLLEELVQMGTNPTYVCWKPHSRNEPTGTGTTNRAPPTEGSSDEEEEDEDETSTSSQNATAQNENSNQNSNSSTENERQSIALVDYILNTMKFIDAILSNNSTDDHCREFIIKGGIPPLLRLLGLPNLPADCPANNPAQAVATVCKSILSLAQEPFIFQEGLRQLNQVLKTLLPLSTSTKEIDGCIGGSKLLMELIGTTDITTAFNCAQATPLLHAMGAAHGYVLMFVHVCRTGQTEIRNLSLLHWGSEEGVKVLQGLSNLYTALVWESTLLLAYCSDDLMFSENDFTRECIEKLNQFFDRCETTQGIGVEPSSSSYLGTESLTPGNSIEPESNDQKLDNRNLKYIKSLLGASSRLGRALAELFGLLVKLCVGPPVRQRRNQHIASPPLPSPQARKVAHALNSLLVKALDCDSVPPIPTLKCQLTFLICSIGFASPMLFDERRYPYYLMLEKFVSVGGLSVFFKTFKWAVDIADLEPAYSPPEGLFGFLDSWLTLLEKMVNSKAVLESPHIISSRPNRTYYFDVIKYLTQVHRLAFDSIQRLWERAAVSVYGNRITETILVILKHIYVDEKILKEKLKQEEQKEEQSPTNSNFAIRENDDNLRQLVDMGFSREDAIDALLNSTTLEQATDYLLTYPPHLRLSSAAKETEADNDTSSQDVKEPLSIAGCSLDNPHKNMADLEIALDKFSEDIVKLCVEFLLKMPDLIHKACDLLVTIMKRNGTTFRNHLLESLSNNIILSGRYLTTRIAKLPTMMPDTLLNEMAVNEQCAKRLCNFVHMFILFYEPSYYYEMKMPPLTIYGTPALNVVTELLKEVEEFGRETYKIGCSIPPPLWIAYCMLLLDTYARMAHRTDRKNKMHISTGRVWKWYDLVAGKWTYYSQTNNKLINDAYWSGEQSVKVTCGRRRYTITFQTMLQMNDETLNNRPVAMVLLSQMHTSCSNIDEEPPEDALFEELSHTERNRCLPIPHLSKMEIHKTVKLCATLLHLPLDKHTLHAVLQISVRFTRNYDMAKLFVKCGGIRCLLNMKHINDFGGFAVLSTILIRHALEEPGVLAYAMERVVRARALRTIPPAYRDLVYLMRQLGAVVTRDPVIFFQVAESNLKIDTIPAKAAENLDTFPLRVDPPPAKPKIVQFQESTSFEVIYELLDALLKPLDDNRKEAAVGENCKNGKDKPVVKEVLTKKKITKDIPSGGVTKENEKATTSSSEKDERGKPMLTKSVILKILSDAVVSYAPVAKLITDHIYRANCCDIIKEDTTVLAFIFDKILPEVENISDSDCSTMCRMLIASLAAANLCPEVQSSLVGEVKMALNRALLLPESLEKHSQIQHICGIISTMIDHCPSHGRILNVLPTNNIIKVMIRRGLLNDLAKIPHFLELSSPHTPFTANASLKPLESLSRTINQPSQNTSTAKGRKANNGSTEDSANVSTEPTGRLEEDDSENIEDAPLENTLDRTIAENDTDRLEEIMEQILEGGPERDRNASMELDEEGPLTYDPERDATEELMSTDSGESDSNPSDQAEDEGNNDDDGDDDNMDDNDDNEDNNFEDENSGRERRNRGRRLRDSEMVDDTSGLFRVSTYDREEDVLMIHYERENDAALPRMIRWNENGYTVPMLEDNSGDHAIIHPLLLTRNTTDSNQNSTPRTQRINRARRYQYLFNPRHPNPPVILQRLLGTHDPHAMANMMTANNILSAPVDIAREQARVVIMDNFGLIPSNEEQIDFVDQSGYLFGPSLAATLSHVPPVVHWWNMESKLLDIESVFDCTSWICNRLLPRLIKTRNAELRYRKFKDEEEKSMKRKSKSDISSPFHGFDAKNHPNFSGLNFDNEDPHSLIFQYNRLMEGHRQNRDTRRPVEPQERNQDPEGRIVTRQALVINYPSDSSSGDSTSNRGRDSNQPVVNELRVALTDVLVNPPSQEDDEPEEDVDIDIDPVILTAGFRMPNNILADLSVAQDTDVAPVEASSDNSLNFSNETNHSEENLPDTHWLRTHTNLSPSQISFLLNENSNSNESSQNTPIQPGIREIVIERSEDSNSQVEINVGQNVTIGENQERVRTIRENEPVSLQAIFEHTINQQIEGLSGGVEHSQAENASSSRPLSQNSPTREAVVTQRDQASGTSGTLYNEFENSANNEEFPRTQRLQFPGPSHARDDEEIPEGVDPSFLEALPPEIRREVIEQHQILCLQQRLAARTTATTGTTNVVSAAAAAVAAVNSITTEGATASNEGPQEVSPEFLAALPPSLQEEVLTQQRIEQQRQAAARAPPNEPVDAQAFFQTLQPSLRTMILSDMEDSQMSALPPELAAEAQTLRRDWYARNRQLAQERYLQRNLPAIIRHTRGGRQAHRPITFQRGGSWGALCRDFTSNTNRTVNTAVNNVKVRGRQLLELDSIGCLLILLFTDDPHLNKLRLSRVIRNLCFHGPTREWIINALLSIVDKSVHCKSTERKEPILDKTTNPSRAGPFTSKLQTDVRHLTTGGHWLTIRMEAALGCAASVFLINKEPGKKADRISGYNVIDIHPQAAPIVCRNTLDLLIALAKAFPQCLLPIKLFRDDMLERSTTPVKPNAQSQSDFWDILLKLDSAAAKKGKSIAKSSAAPVLNESEPFTFENSVFGRLLDMLGSPYVHKNTQLTDHILKVLSVTTTCMPELKSHRFKKSNAPNVSTGIVNNSHINTLSLAVNVITYKNCSVEGLEYITNMLLNIASSSQDISLGILNLLLEGASKIGVTVETQIKNMLVDLKDIDNVETKRTEEAIPATSKGIIYNRFTNEQVVITASTKIKGTCELQLPSMVPLTSKSSSQTFFLRVLRVIVQIRNSFKNNIKRSNSEGELPALSEQLGTLESLWQTLSKCLFELEHAPDHHAVLVLQPAVEAFFLVHSPQQAALSHKLNEKADEGSVQNGPTLQTQPTENSAPDVSGSARPGSQLSLASTVTIQGSSNNDDYRVSFDFEHRQIEPSARVVTPEQQKFLTFAEKHRTVLNQILRQSTAHLADGPFAVLVDHTRILDFDIKRRYFRTELERMDHGVRREETAVHVRRSNVFEDSFRELFRRAPEEWKNRFYIVFEDEEGQDAGGLLREWYVIISRDIFNPMYALFTVSPGDRVTYMINSASHYNSNHLCYYKFVGRVIAKAIYDNKLLECYFTRSFYKHILGISVKYTDMESEDYSFYRGLVYLMENNINNLGLDLTFSTEISEFGVTETRDLIPNGRHIAVTEENKMEYVRLVCQMKMTGAIKQQLTAFLEGFYDIIPMRLISIFNEQELELLISGLPNIDIDDLKANTEYHKYQSNSLQIQWFWRALRSFDQADRAKFLQFVTGTSKVPLQGFGALEGMNGVQKFQIHRDDRCTDRLPSAHTCFNQLDLPVYETYDKLRAYLLKAIHECSEGFGFA